MAQPPNNAPSPQPAAFSIVNNWAYPFPARDARPPMTALKFLAALASAEDGFYPLGVNGVWHGGIHFGDGTRGTLDQNGGVRCIADGEVVAYRIDTKYPQLTCPDGRKALYSSGFTLVRHHLVLPPVPGSAPASNPTSSPASSPTPTSPNTPPSSASPNTPDPADTLTFFTLYMHVLDWAGYQADAASNAPVKKSLPAYYKGKTISVVGSKAKDAQAPAVTPANAPQPADTGTSTGADTTTPPVLGIHLHDAPNGHNLGILPQGSRLTIGQIHGHWGKIASIESGTPVPLQLGGTLGPQAAQGWVYLKWLDRTGEPDPLDTIVILDPPHSVQAGDVIAYLGEYQRAGDVTTLPPQPTRPMLHLETFTGDDLPSYLTRSRARAEQLPAAQRTILVIAAGAVLVQLAKPDQTLAYDATVQATADSPNGSLWVKVQQTQAASGNASPPVLQPVGAAFWISYANLANPSGCVAWSTFPLKPEGAVGPKAAYLRAIPVADLNAVAKDDQGNTWYQVPVGVDDGNTALGWVCDKNHPLVKLDSPWAWPGFEAVELDATIMDLFKRALHISNDASGDEIASFKQTFELLRNAPLLKKLENAIDSQGEKDGKITATELRGALREPWLADVIQRLIVRYESEWGGEMSKWDALTPLMHAGAPFWQTEMSRIEKLKFWPQVAAVKGFPALPKVYHWHPVGLVGNFSGCPSACKTEIFQFDTREGVFIISKEAFEFILAAEGYKDHPYVPDGDQSSGVTIGYGYDLGQQSSAQIATDLSGIFSLEQIARLQGAAGKHGSQARQLQPSLENIPVTKDMALRLAVVMKRRYAQQTVDAFPGVRNLHPHCQGALLSLVINRGPGMVDEPHQKTRAQMRKIRSDVASNNSIDVPVQLRAMKALWAGSGQGGLLIRRENEAVLFEKGINCNCWR